MTATTTTIDRPMTRAFGLPPRESERPLDIVVVARPEAHDERAVERAAEIAHATDARLHVVRTLALGGRIVRGAAEEHAADVVVLGGDRGPLFDALAGGAPDAIAARIDRPVLVVHGRVRRPYPHAVVAVDPDTDLPRLLRATRLVAHRARISFVHAFGGVSETTMLLDGVTSFGLSRHLAALRREAWSTLTEKIADAGGDPSRLVLRHGSAQRVLVREERRWRAQGAVFVFERRRSLVPHVVVESLPRVLVRDGRSDVLVV